VQATLAELTAAEIAKAVRETAEARVVAICGGGVRNNDLMSRLQRLLPETSVKSTKAWGLAPEWVEAAAFAWLARQRLRRQPDNMPSVTGARRRISLGAVYLPPG